MRGNEIFHRVTANGDETVYVIYATCMSKGN